MHRQTQNKRRRKSTLHGRRKAPKTSPVVVLNEAFDAETNNGDSRTEVGFTRDGLSTEVGSTDDDNMDEDNEDGSDGKTSEEI